MSRIFKTQTEEEKNDQQKYWEWSRDMLKKSGGFLQENLHLILNNKQTILDTPEYFFSGLFGAEMVFRYKYLIHISTGNIPLGALLKLWNDKTLIKPCAKCGGDFHIYYWDGLIGYSRVHDYMGVCYACGEYDSVVTGENPEDDMMKDLTDKIDHAKSIIREKPNEEIAKIIKPGVRQHFSWSKGLVPEIPEVKEIIKPKTVPMDIEDVVRSLKGEPIEPKQIIESADESKREFKSNRARGFVFTDNGLKIYNDKDYLQKK
jgi:hypothetical protein